MLHSDLENEKQTQTLLVKAIEENTPASRKTALEIIPTLASVNFRSVWQTQDGRAYSVLNMACYLEQTEIITALLLAKANPHFDAEVSCSAFQMAFRLRRWNTVSLLLESSQVPHDRTSISDALTFFLSDLRICGSSELFRQLVSAGVNINATYPTSSAYTSLFQFIFSQHFLTQAQKIGYVEFLLEQTAEQKINPNIVRNALVYAATGSYGFCPEIISKMLSHESFKTNSDELGLALYNIFNNRSASHTDFIFAIIIAIIKQKANVNIMCSPTYASRESTPLHAAVKTQNYLVITALLLAGANPNAQNAKGMTPLQILDKAIKFFNSEKDKRVFRNLPTPIQQLEAYKTAQQYYVEITSYKLNLAIIFRSKQPGNTNPLFSIPLELQYIILSMAAPNAFNEIWNSALPNSKLKSVRGIDTIHNMGFLLWVKDKQEKVFIAHGAKKNIQTKIACFKYIYNELRASQGYFTTNALKNWEHLTDHDYLSAVATYAAQNQTSRTAVALSLMNHVNGDKNHPELKMLIAQTLKSEQPGLFNHVLSVFRVNSGGGNQVEKVKKM